MPLSGELSTRPGCALPKMKNDRKDFFFWTGIFAVFLLFGFAWSAFAQQKFDDEKGYPNLTEGVGDSLANCTYTRDPSENSGGTINTVDMYHDVQCDTASNAYYHLVVRDLGDVAQGSTDCKTGAEIVSGVTDWYTLLQWDTAYTNAIMLIGDSSLADCNNHVNGGDIGYLQNPLNFYTGSEPTPTPSPAYTGSVSLDFEGTEIEALSVMAMTVLAMLFLASAWFMYYLMNS